MENNVRAFIVEQDEEKINAQVKIVDVNQFEGDVLIQVAYASVNYKDGLTTQKGAGVVGRYPLIPGIDFSGTVLQSNTRDFEVGEKVFVASLNILKFQNGGYAEQAWVKKEQLLKLPETLSLKEAALIGTAGFTAGLSVHALIEDGITPATGEILVLGATGGVGSFAVTLLTLLGYRVTAASRNLKKAKELFGKREIEYLQVTDILEEKQRLLGKESWAAVIDPIGGAYVGRLLSQLQYNGGYYVSGNTAGIQFETSVLPFILRGIKLVGIDSVQKAQKDKQATLNWMGEFFKDAFPYELENREIGLGEVQDALHAILDGNIEGRVVVKIAP